MKRSFGIVVCVLAACACVVAVEQRWRDDLWLGRGGYWRARVGVTVENTSDEAWEGRSVSVPLAKLPLAGTRVEEIRLVDARGVQLEFGVWSGHSEFVTEGPVPADGMFVIPVVCDAHASADFCIYYDNPAAWGLADFWKERPAKLLNGSFEAIGKDCPEGWRLCIPDAQHRLSVDTAAYAGARCIKAEADAGAAPSWFSFSQDSIPVRAGERITLRVMVRAKDVKGQAGWYVHAGHEKRSDVLNRVFSAGNGTFDWKKLEMKVTIPPDCTKMTVGSVLRGTGTAWYDAFEIERETPLPEPKVSVGAAERLNVREIGADAPWLAAKPGEGAWQYRVPVRAANFTDEAQLQTLSACALSEALRATRSAEYALTFNGRELRTCQLGNQLLFSCELPARSISTFYLYVRSGRGGAEEKPEELKSALGSAIPSDQILVKRPRLGDAKTFEALLNGPANLVRNPSWEADRAGWTTGPGKPDGISYEVVTTGGRFGNAFAKVEIPRTVRPNWNGWRQQVKVKPGHMYLYGAFISGDDLQTYATVHMHQRTARGALAQGGMMSAGRGVNGTAPWTPVFGTARASADAAIFDLQLTMNGTGTVAYDGVLVAEYAAARTGDPEFPASEAGAPALRVVQVDPVVKVFRETPVDETPGTAFGISLARNETEPLQLAVRTSRAAADLTAQVELSAPLKVEVGRVRHVPVDHPTSYYSCTTPVWELRYPRNGGSSDGWGGWWPDPIDPVVGGPAPANETQVFWINVTAGTDVQPGMYTGKITWKADGATVRTDTFSVKVWNFTLDAPPYFPAIYDLRVGWQWKGLGATSDERREKLWAFLAKKKCCPDRLGAEVKFKKGADGTVTADFTEYDRLAARYFDHYRFPVSYMSGCFYCFGWAMPPRPFLGENPYEGEWPYEGADWTKLRPAYKNLYQQALRLYWNHVKEKGWADKLVLYISDEPHFSRTNVVLQMKACCEMIHEVDPKIPIYSSTWRHCPEWNDSLNVWGIGHYGCFPVDEMKARVKAGSRFWWTTDGQMCTDTPYCAVERMLPLYARAFGADAYEFWGCTWLTYDPWKFGWHSYIRQSDTPGKTYWVRYPAGDGFLIYPPHEGGTEPVSTIRLEAARDGVEDYNYLVLLDRMAAGTDARAAEAARLAGEFRALVSIPNAGGRYSTRILPEPEKLASLRLRAGELLSR